MKFGQLPLRRQRQQVSAVNYFSDLQSFGAKAIAEMQQVNANNLASMKSICEMMGAVAFMMAGLSTSDLYTLDQDVASASGSDSLAGSFVQTSGDASNAFARM